MVACTLNGKSTYGNVIFITQGKGINISKKTLINILRKTVYLLVKMISFFFTENTFDNSFISHNPFCVRTNFHFI